MFASPWATGHQAEVRSWRRGAGGGELQVGSLGLDVIPHHIYAFQLDAFKVSPSVISGRKGSKGEGPGSREP